MLSPVNPITFSPLVAKSINVVNKAPKTETFPKTALQATRSKLKKE